MGKKYSRKKFSIYKTMFNFRSSQILSSLKCLSKKIDRSTFENANITKATEKITGQLNLFLNILSVLENKRLLGRIENPVNARKLETICTQIGLKYTYYSGLNYKYLFFSKKRSVLSYALYLHSSNPFKEEIPITQNTELGRLYGYPNCCIPTFIENIRLMMHEQSNKLKMKTLCLSPSAFFSVYTNNFNTFKPIFHYVHSYDCKMSEKTGRENLKIIRDYSYNLYNHYLNSLHLCIIKTKQKYFFIKNFTVSDKKKIVLSLNDNIKDLIKETDGFQKGAEYVLKPANDRSVKFFVFQRI